MSVEYVRPGDNIEIDIILAGRTSGNFVKAIVQDPDGFNLYEILLTDLGFGRYYDNSVVKNSKRMTVLFEVYDDSGLTQKNNNFQDDKAIIAYESPPLLETVTQAIIPENEIRAEVVDEGEYRIEAIIGDSFDLDAIIIGDDELSGEVDDSSQLSGTLNDDSDIFAEEN